MSTKDSRISSFFKVISAWRGMSLALTLWVSFSAAQLGHIRIIQFSQPLTIRSAAQSPAKIAFEMIHAQAEKREPSSARIVQLMAEPSPVALAQTEVEGDIPSPGQALIQSVRQEAQIAQREQSYQRFYETLSSSEKQTLFLATQKNPDLLADTSIPRTEELLDQAFVQATAATPSASHPGVYVSAGGETSGQAYGSRLEGSRVRTHSASLAEGAFRLKGQINIPVGAGVALLEGQNLEVFWVSDGNASAPARLDKDFNYSIELKEMSGKIVAQIVDEKGRVSARGERKISSRLTHFQRERMNIELGQRDRFEVAVSGQSAQGGVTLLNGATGEEIAASPDGQVLLPDWAEGSVLGVRVAAPGSSPALQYLRAGQKADLKLMSKSTVLALMDIIDQETLSMNRERNGSLVWGKVTLDGRPMAGIRIEIEGLEEERPVYFNNAFDAFYFPNRELSYTTSNGIFAISHLPRGLYALKAYQGDQFFGHALVEVDDGTVTPAEVQGSRFYTVSHVKAFNAFSGEPAAAQVELQSASQGLEVNGYAQVRFRDNKQMALLQASFADDAFEPIISTYHNDDEEILVPGIRKDWLRQIRREAKVSDRPGSGVLVVFTGSEVDEVYLPTEHGNFHRLVFFDAQGYLVPSSTPGGGFIIFNVSEGAQLVVVEQKTGMKASRFLSVTPGWVATTRTDF